MSWSQSLYLRSWLQAFDMRVRVCVCVCMYISMYVCMYVFALCLRHSYTFTFRFSLPYYVFKWGRNITGREKSPFYQTSVVWKMGHLVKASRVIEEERRAPAENHSSHLFQMSAFRWDELPSACATLLHSIQSKSRAMKSLAEQSQRST